MKDLVIIVGPTAVGKTDSSIQIAKRLNGEIISADSMQIYRQMDIGTAKIREDEMDGVRHHMIDIVDPCDEFSVSDFQERAYRCIEDISSRGKLPIVVGGTGLYINSLVYKLDFSETHSDQSIRDIFYRYAEVYGNEYIHDRLRVVDPETAKKLSINDTKRIVRALEVYQLTGSPMSEYNKNFREENDNFNLAFMGLTMDRQILYDRINTRVDKMIEEGLIDEVKNLLDNGYTSNCTSMKAIGYKEVIDYIEGELSYEDMISILKRNSRRFAKRQLTWFRRDRRIEWFYKDQYNQNELIDSMYNYCKEKLKGE